MDAEGNEYYAIPLYAKDNNQSEIYAKKSNNDEFYLQQGNDGQESFALKKDSKGQLVPYFATTSTNIPICPILEVRQKFLKSDISYPRHNNKDVYPKRNNREYYIMNGNISKYAKNEFLDEFYAINEQQQPYYGGELTNEGFLVEIPARDHNHKTIYIESADSIQYPFDESKNRPIYPVLDGGDEMYLEKNNVQIYAKNKQNLPVYAKKGNGDDYLASNNGIPYYAYYNTSDAKKIEYYPKLKNRRQFYLRSGKKKIYAKHNFDEKYAKTENQNDFLAEDDSVQYYATKNNNEEEFYPSLSSGKNFYRLVDSKELIAMNKTTKLGFYAKDEFKNQFYPKDFNKVEQPNVAEIELPVLVTEPTLEEILKHEA